MKKLLLILPIALMLNGCAWLTGLENAEDDFACSVDMPATCASLTTVHNSIDAPKEAQSFPVDINDDEQTNEQTKTEPDPVRITLREATREEPLGAKPDANHLPIREREQIARIWLAPYVDESGELYGEQFVWVTVKAAHWRGLPPITHEEDAPKMMRPLGTLSSMQDR